MKNMLNIAKNHLNKPVVLMPLAWVSLALAAKLNPAPAKKWHMNHKPNMYIPYKLKVFRSIRSCSA